MNKADLISAIADSTDQTKDAVAKTIEAALITITASLARGESTEIAASKAPKFKAGKKLKDAVNA
jgi:nucleoid DNA-binding protein